MESDTCKLIFEVLILCWLIDNWIFPFWLEVGVTSFNNVLNAFCFCAASVIYFRVRNRLLLSAAVFMTWIPRSACPLRLARTLPSHLLQLPASSPMQTSSAKSSVNSWRRNEHTSKSVSLILFVRSRWSFSVCMCSSCPSICVSLCLGLY